MKCFNYIVTGLLVAAVAYILIDNLYLDKRAIQTGINSDVRGQKSSSEKEAYKAIAVLPFSDFSPEKDQEYFVDGLSEEIINNLAQIPELRVTARTASFSFKEADKTLQEIASVLGVEYILEGSVRKAGNALRITAQLYCAADDVYPWSKTYDRELRDIFAVQEDISTDIADGLKVALGLGAPKQLGGTDNVEAFELYLVAKGIYARISGPEDAQRALTSINEALELDPKFALAWAQKAKSHLDMGINSSKDRIPLELDSARNAAMRTVEAEPELAEGVALLGGLNWLMGEWIQADDDFRRAFEMADEPSSLWDKITWYYASVGNFKRAYELTEAARKNDLLDMSTRNQYIFNLGLLGDIRGAEKENERCLAVFGNTWKANSWAITYLRLGSGAPVSRDEIRESNTIDDIGKAHLDSPEKGLSALRRIYNDEKILLDPSISPNALFADMSLWAAYFGDPEFALDATEKAFGLSPGRTWHIWYPVMHEVRQLPRFKEFIKEIGLVDYWNRFGWPDICQPLENGDFECD